jgi:hypothetical protein
MALGLATAPLFRAFLAFSERRARMEPSIEQ